MGMLFWVALGTGLVLWLRRQPDVTTGELQPDDACTVVRRDGPYRICLRQVDEGWSWEAERDEPIVFDEGDTIPQDEVQGGVFQDMEQALAAAWLTLIDVVGTFPLQVVEFPIARHGLLLGIDGEVTVTDKIAYINKATPIVSQAQLDGDSAAGIVLTVLLEILGDNWNPFRARLGVNGGLGKIAAAAARIQAIEPLATVDALNPPAVARAIFNLSPG